MKFGLVGMKAAESRHVTMHKGQQRIAPDRFQMNFRVVTIQSIVLSG